MAKDVRFVIGANVDRAEQEIRKLQSTGKDVSDSLANSFEQLGIRSSMAIEKERAAAVSAYDRIKASGVGSAEEITRAQAAMQQQLSRLDDALNPLPAKFTAIDKEIAAMAGSGQASTDRLTRSFEQLGIRSTQSLEQERAAAVSAFDRIRKSGVASADEIARAQAAMQQKVAGLDAVLNPISGKLKAMDSGLKDVRGSSDSLGGSFANLKTAAAGVIAGFGVNELIQARIEMDKIKNSLAATSGATAGSDYKYMRGEVDRLGLSLQSTAKDFGMMTASSKGTSLEGEQTRKIFSAVTGASTVLGLSADDTSGILRALNQMISKGTVQAEELKGQLGERLPGAFAMAARAMGLTTAELQKHLETGTVLASDLLPKLAIELEKTYGSKTAASAKSTQAELNRLHTSFFELKAKAADGDTFAGFFRAATGTTKVLGDNLDVVKVGLYAVTASSVISGLGALAAKIGTIGTLSAATSAGLYGVAAAAGYAIGKGIDKVVYKTTGLDMSGNNGYEASQRRLVEAQGKLDAVSEKLRAVEVAENTAKEKAAQAKKEAEALMAKELEVFKAHQEAKTALTREQKAIELATMKGAYDQGLVATEAYYQKEKQIALDAAKQELANAKEYLAKESALLSNIQGRSKDGKKTTELVEEQAKHEKAIEAVQMAELKLSHTTIDENNKIVAGLKTRDEAYLKIEQSYLESNGQYVEAGQIREQLEKQSIEMLRLKADALAGVIAAVQALADKENAAALRKIADQQKDQSTVRQYADDYAALQEKISASNGEDSAYLSAKSALRDEINKKIAIENKLDLARTSGNIAEYNHQSRMLAGQNIRNTQLEKEVELKRRAADLSAVNDADQLIINDLVAKGLNDEAFWFRKKVDARKLAEESAAEQEKYSRSIEEFTKKIAAAEQAGRDAEAEKLYNMREELVLAKEIAEQRARAAQYAIADRQPVTTTIVTTPIPGGAPVLPDNMPGPPAGYARGTNYIPADGYYFLHKKEAVVPEKYNPAAGGQSAGNSISIGDLHFSFPSVTNQSNADDFARQMVPALKKHLGRSLG